MNYNSDSKKEEFLSEEFWNTRWINHETGWDIGYASPAILHFFETIEDKEAKILIPGCGNAYEAENLQKLGFKNITLIDIAPKAVELLKEKFASYPNIRIICADFFQHEDQYDYIVEQTFFCAINPSLRKNYVQKTSSLLNKGGQIVGLLFDTEFEKQGPPFGGQYKEYLDLFDTDFEIEQMSRCTLSIEPRKDKELFIQLIKK